MLALRGRVCVRLLHMGPVRGWGGKDSESLLVLLSQAAFQKTTSGDAKDIILKPNDGICFLCGFLPLFDDAHVR